MRRTGFVALAGIAALAAAPAAQAAHGGGKAWLRVLHASPDAPAVDVYVDGAKAVTDLDRGEITGYVQVGAGAHTWAIRPNGASPSSAPVASGRLRLRGGSVSTVEATGFLRAHGKQGFAVRALRDAATNPFGVARLRVAHLSPDTPAVDVVVQGGDKVVRRLRYPNATGYLRLPAGTYTFFVRPSGTSTNALTLSDVRVQAGKSYTAWALGALAPRTGELGLKAVLTDDPLPAALATTRVRILHASPDAPRVGICVNGARAIRGISFGQAWPYGGRGYAELPAAATTVRVVAPNGRCSQPGLLPDVDLGTLPAAATLTVAASGELTASGAEQPFALRPLADDVSPTTGRKARVTVAHLGSNVPPVGIFAGSTNLFGATIAFGTQRSTELPAGGYTVDVKVGSTVAASPSVHLRANSSTTVYAIGKVSPGAGEQGLTFRALTSRVG